MKAIKSIFILMWVAFLMLCLLILAAFETMIWYFKKWFELEKESL